MRDPTGQAGSYVGDEIDFRFNINVDRHHNVLVGYSKLFAGDFLKATAPRVSPGSVLCAIQLPVLITFEFA